MQNQTLNKESVKIDTKLEVRTYEHLYDNELELITSAKLDNIAPIEAWTAIGTNNQLAYATHGAFRYFGKFPPPIATHLIIKYTFPGDTVCDPMCGSGTTGVETVLLNRKAILNDINPLSCLLADVKTRKLSDTKMREAVKRIKREYIPLSEIEYDFNPVGLKNTDHWFLPETKKSLRGIKKLIDDETDNHIKNFLFVAYAATVRRVSKATTQQGRLFLDVDTAVNNALPFFLKRVEIIIKGINQLPNNTYLPEITSFNLLEKIPKKFYNIADLLIVHPPYFNLYKFSSINSLELSWLGINYNEIRKKEIKEFFKVGKPENVTRYVDDMVEVINNVAKILKPNSPLALMIGDTIMKGKHITVTKKILDKIDKTKFNVELISLRTPKYTEASWVASQRRKSNNVGITLYDFIVVIRSL